MLIVAKHHTAHVRPTTIKTISKTSKKLYPYKPKLFESERSINAMITYIKTHWKGENSLAWAYWINGALLSGIVSVAITLADKEQIISHWLSWLLLAIAAVGVSIWSAVGIWRSAGRSIERNRTSVPKESSFWAYAAKFMVIIGALQGLAASLPGLKDLTALYKLRESNIVTQFYIQYLGETDLILNGYINVRSVEAVKNAFLANKELKALILNSPGGLLLPAYHLADFVEQRGIFVGARSECRSACLLILAAAKIAFATPDTRLVFHHPQGAVDFVSPDMTVELNKEIEEYYRRFLRYGVPAEKLYEYRRLKLKIISVGEAFEIHIVDKIWEPTTNKIYEIEDICKRTNCFKIPMRLP